MLGPNLNEQLTCENFGTLFIKMNTVRHKRRYSPGALDSFQCPHFSTISHDDLKYHIAKKQSDPKVVTIKCKHCCQKFPGFDALRQQKKHQTWLS